MAEALKSFFDRALVERLAASMAAVYPSFPVAAFVERASRGLGRLELLDRARHIAAALAAALPADFERASEIVIASLAPPLGSTERFGMEVFFYLPHVVFAAEQGIDHFEPAMRLQRELTRRFSAEFSIRAFLERYPEPTLDRLRRWASDPDPHVRRLVSEGTRPRLPWAPRLRAFQRDPAPVLALLELLKDDPVGYVRRSVANNLNDIGKDHPELLVATCERWAPGASAERRALIEHALRGAIKRGDPRALSLVGATEPPSVQVAASFSPRRVSIGGKVAVRVEVQSDAPEARVLVIDLAVHFVKASGATSAKVFKLRRVELGPGERVTIPKTLSFRQQTTRTHYPGRHRVEALVNGQAFPLGAIQVV